VLPNRIGNWSLTSLQQRLVKTGGRLVKHARYYWLLLAESHLTKDGGWVCFKRNKSIPDRLLGGFMLIRKLLRRAFCIVMLAAVSFHPAYAQDRPDHKNALSQIIRQISDDRFYTITKLEYANGFQKDPNNYVVLTTFTKVFKVSSSTYGKSATSDNPLQAFAERLVLSNLYGHFEPGDSFDESAKFSFLRTEKGWILQGFEGDSVVETRHTEHADVLDAQAKRLAEQRAQEEKVQQQKAQEAATMAANAAANERERHLVEVKNACASRQQMKIIGYGNISVLGLQGAGAFGGYLGEGQVVVGVPDDAKSLAAMAALLRPDQRSNDVILLGWLRGMCRVQYSVSNRMFSGYVPVDRLGVVSPNRRNLPK
jgi:hypothetical protein